MEKLETRIRKISKRSMTTTIVLLIIGIAFIIGGAILSSKNPEEYMDFDKFTTKSEYAKTDVKYLMGPFAEETENGRVTKEFYVAEGNDGNCFVIATKKNTEMPIYGEDVYDEDLENMDSLESIRIYGYTDLFDTELEGFLLDSYNVGLTEEEKLNSTTCTQWLGIYYIDTTMSQSGTGAGMYIFGGIFVLIAIVGLVSSKKNKKNMEKTLEELKTIDKWNDIKADYEMSSIITYKKIDLELGNKYLYCFFNGITIIAYENIKKVYASNIVDGKAQMVTYIAVETKDNKKYYISPKPNNTRVPQFEQAINAIKEKITVIE